MKRVKFKRSASVFIATAMTLALVQSTTVKVKAVETAPTVIYSNDFEDSTKLPKDKTAADLAQNVNGSTVLSYNYTFDKNSTWDQKDIEIYTEYGNVITSGAKLRVDVILPKDSTFNGGISFKAATQIGTDWKWTEADSMQSLAVDKFTTVGDYKIQTIDFTFGDQIAAAQGIHSIFLQVIGNGCDYNGKFYIDNVRFIDGVSSNSSTEEKVVFKNDFEDTSKLPTSKTADDVVENVNGSKAVKFDYIFDANSGWDGKEIEIPADYADPIASGAKLKVDILLPKNSTFAGAITVKGVTKMGDSYAWTESNAVEKISIGDFAQAGDYLIKSLEFTFGDNINAVNGLHAVCFQLAGNNCDYSGKVFIDNVIVYEGGASSESSEESSKYVLKTEEVTAQAKVEPGNLSIPNNVSLVDAKATAKTANLYAYMLAVGKSDNLIFGHQNDTTHKAGSSKLSNSDTKDVTGSISGVVAIDSLSMTGAELSLPAGDTRDLVTATADVCADASKEGSIISLSMHMPNFDLIAKKGKINGKWDYTGYTPNVTTGDVVQRIMPGGDLNEVFLGYLDMIADFGKQLEVKDIPVLYRPFHENSGSWFWWGAAECDRAAFKNVWRYTVEYLRDVKDVHNFLYVYSPGGPVETEESYLDRYPGDDYVDVMAFDMYNNDPTTTDNFPTILADSMKVIDGLAAKHNKLTAVSETGMLVSGKNGISITGNKRLSWFGDVLQEVAKTNAAYFLTWANFSESGFFMPYMTDETHGHEMINEFIKFYNDDKSVFADGIGDYSKINVTNTKLLTNTTGYITSPYSGLRMLEPTTVTASVKNTDKEVKFVLKDGNGNAINSLKATVSGGSYSAQITDDILKSIKPCYGSISLTIDGIEYDSIKILFNIKETSLDPAIVDDFEYYYGNDALLGLKWAPNAGAGCSVTPMTDSKKDEHNNGESGLAFKYKISTEKISEGWAGVTKSITADWSDKNALQLWIKPDGYGQKLVIQITSNGEDFEVHLPEFAATKEAKLVTIPFAKFVGKNKGTFDPSKVTSFGIWCNTIIPSGQTSISVDSTMYFDDIMAVKTEFTDINFADVDNDDTGNNPEGTETGTDNSEGTGNETNADGTDTGSNANQTNTVELENNTDGSVSEIKDSNPGGTETGTSSGVENTESTSQLPKTGSYVDGALLLQSGAIMLLAGAAVIIISRKRKNAIK